jgi:hypothetical protein
MFNDLPASAQSAPEPCCGATLKLSSLALAGIADLAGVLLPLAACAGRGDE